MTFDPDVHDAFLSRWVEESLAVAIVWAQNLGLDADMITQLQRCPRHGDPLQLGTATIRYGKPHVEVIRQMKREAELLPYRNLTLLGGCGHDGHPAQRSVVFCPACRAAKAVR